MHLPMNMSIMEKFPMNYKLDKILTSGGDGPQAIFINLDSLLCFCNVLVDCATKCPRPLGSLSAH